MIDAKHELPALADQWNWEDAVIAMSSGKGSQKRLTVRTRFDGNGNSVVRFFVKDHDNETSYEKFDAAVYNYNRAV